nr:HAMP domain-containing sensor histidine kinase [Allorhizocola rhizosphaerae]
MSSWPLRTRLVAATMALLALAFLVVGVTAVATLQKALYGRIDGQLAAAAKRAPYGMKSHGGPGDSDCDKPKSPTFPAGQAIGTLSVRVCDGVVKYAEVLCDEGQPKPDVAPYYSTLLTVQPGQPPTTYPLGELGDYRIVAQHMPDGAVLLTGLPLSDLQDTLYLVSGVVLGVMVLSLGGVAGGGTVIVRRTLRPLERVAATATKVSQLRLDKGEVELAQRVGEADTDPRTEVGRVGAALNRMLDHVGNALEVRHASETRVRQFVADASHELRTPLAAIRGYAELSRRTHEPVPPELEHILRRVESEAKRMGVLVDDLLLLARLDSGRPLAQKPVDLTAMLVDAVSDAHVLGPKHGWRLELPEEPVVVVGDAARLHQVVANLLANARTHTPEGTIVTASVALLENEAVLTVVDDGPGIPEALLPQVFERFARGDSSRSRKAGSSGLGLAIVQAVVAAHRGAVSVDSRPGRTAFTVRLPTSPR